MKGKLLQVIMLAFLLLSSTVAFAQAQVRGLVTDKTGEPLIGVNVLEKGTTNGVITDYNGQFSLNVAQGKTLVFSYVGYISEEVVVKGSQLKVVLAEDSKTLDEVVVVGYGSMSRKDVTSSITTVKADKLNVGVYSDPAQLLQGKVPGLTVVQSSDPTAGTASISLRGASSLRTGEAMEPYYVVDGIPGVSLSLVAPEDIESIDVLRDASATAIYGSKAANGVILITTKKGSKAEHTSVNYSAYVAVDNIAKNLDMMSADDLRAYAKANGFDLYNDQGANTKWSDEVLRTAVSHNHNLSINGGSEKTQYSASLSYQDKQGIVRGTDYERFGGRAFVQTKALNDRLTLAFNVNAAQSKGTTVDSEKDGQSVFDAMNYYSPLVPVKNADGTWFADKSISQNYNPMSMIYEDTFENNKKFLNGNVKAILDITKDFKWNFSFSYQDEQDIWNEYHTTNSQYNTRNGEAKRTTTEYKKKVLETYFNYDHTFADVHKLGVMGGYSWEQNDNNDGFGLDVYDFYNDNTSFYNLSLANKMDWQNGGIISNQLETLRMISFYGRVNYSFASKYLLQATIRRDGSSAFGKNNRWGTFPSASLAWRLSEEKFIKDLDLFDDLKFRVGYGVSGNSLGFGAYSAIQTYSTSGWYTYTDANGNQNSYHTLAAASNANPDLKWERTSMLNVGFDFSVLNDRLSGTIEYYDKRTSDLIYNYTVSTNRYPFSTMPANVGDITNRGIELTLSATPVQTKDFSWQTSLNLSHNKNKVKSISNSTYSVDYIDLADPQIAGYSSHAEVQRIMEGEAIGTFYTYEWAGYNEEGISQFYVHDPETGERTGEVTTDPEYNRDRVKTGCAQPDLNLGWSNNLRYKNWSLDLFFTGVFGQDIYNATAEQYSNVGFAKEGRNVLKSVATQQNINDMQSQAPSDRWLENGSYFRLSSLSLGYTFGKLGNWVNSLKVYATCNNVFTITGYSGRDPEISLGGLEPGMDRRTSYYPRTRSFMLGVNINF
jgi:iron complex outermembrane receptor protein